MFNKSRKKNANDVIKNGEQSALRNFDNKNSEDNFIVKNLGINKNNKTDKLIAFSNKKINIKKISIFAFVFLILITIVFSIRFIRFNVVEMLWKTSVTKGSDSINNKSVRYSSFRNGLMRISNDGITYINDKGTISNIPDDEFIKTYLHELGHCFGYYFNGDSSEELACAFSNFFYEYLLTKK